MAHISEILKCTELYKALFVCGSHGNKNLKNYNNQRRHA